jgi:Aminotransferase class-V/Polyketide cyclase / dehydrase and lipid transport
MSPITTTIQVDRSADDVFAYATDPARFSEWQQVVTGGHLDADGAPTVGTLCHTTRRIGGTDRPSVSEVTHTDPPRTWGVRGIDGPIRAIVDLTVEPLTPPKPQAKTPIDVAALGVDLLALVGHKMYAPKGIAALYVRRGLTLEPVTYGGGQEHGLRAGTENVAYAVTPPPPTTPTPRPRQPPHRTARTDRATRPAPPNPRHRPARQRAPQRPPDRRLPKPLNISITGVTGNGHRASKGERDRCGSMPTR